jgi:hypothetical protein
VPLAGVVEALYVITIPFSEFPQMGEFAAFSLSPSTFFAAQKSGQN